MLHGLVVEVTSTNDESAKANFDNEVESFDHYEASPRKETYLLNPLTTTEQEAEVEILFKTAHPDGRSAK